MKMPLQHEQHFQGFPRRFLCVCTYICACGFVSALGRKLVRKTQWEVTSALLTLYCTNHDSEVYVSPDECISERVCVVVFSLQLYKRGFSCVASCAICDKCITKTYTQQVMLVVLVCHFIFHIQRLKAIVVNRSQSLRHLTS